MSKIAVVFGANGTIGSASIDCLENHGYHVEPVYRVPCENAEFENQYIAVDFRYPSLLDSACDIIVKKYNKISLFLNASGIPGHTWNEISAKDWLETLMVNTISPMLIAYKLLPFIESGGCVINITSMAANIAFREPDYSSSKAALVAAMRSFAWVAAEYGVRAVCISPGPVSSPMTEKWSNEERQDRISRTPLKRFAEPNEVADLIAFIASSKAKHIAGTVIDIAGGFEMR